MKSRVLFLVAGLLTMAALPLSAEPEPPVKDVVFLATEDFELKLDFYFPEDVENPPLVVFIHGGGWRNNSYKNCRTPWLTDYGFAVASIGYRLSHQATFPAQIHDCKAAIRWLRAHAEEYGYDATRIGVAGTSAGGHLVALLGVSGGEEALEGTLGKHLDQSSRVQAVVDYFGPTDFILRSQNQPKKTEEEDSPVKLLLGAPVSQNPELAKLASPAFHVTEDDPPLLIFHGAKDKTVYLDQSERIVAEYQKAGLGVTLEVLPDGGHGKGDFFEKANRDKAAAFLKKHLSP